MRADHCLCFKSKAINLGGGFASEIYLSPIALVTRTTVCYKSAIMLLFIHRLLWFMYWILVLFGGSWCIFLFSNHLAEEGRTELNTLELRLFVFCTCLFLVVPWVGLQSVIATFPGHTHFFKNHFQKLSVNAIQRKEVIDMSHCGT